jgi:hypothetical protein
LLDIALENRLFSFQGPSIETEFFVGSTGAGSSAKRFKTLLGIETKVANRLTDLPFRD